MSKTWVSLSDGTLWPYPIGFLQGETKMSQQWYVMLNDKLEGPFSSVQLKQAAAGGKILPTTQVRIGEEQWVLAYQVKGLFETPVPPVEEDVNWPPKTETREASNDGVTSWIDAGNETHPHEPPDTVKAPAIPYAALADVNPTINAELAASRKPDNSAHKTCPFCGENILTAAIKCKHCGEFLDSSHSQSTTNVSTKRILPALLCLLVLFPFGVHAFYAGRPMQGIIFILAFFFGCFLAFSFTDGSAVVWFFLWGILWVSDFIHLVTGSYKDGKGTRISRWT